MVIFTLFSCFLAAKYLSVMASTGGVQSNTPWPVTCVGTTLGAESTGLRSHLAAYDDSGWLLKHELLAESRERIALPCVFVNPALVVCSETGYPNRSLKWERQKSTSFIDHMGLGHEIGPETFSTSSRFLCFVGTWMWKTLPELGSSWMRLWVQTSMPKGQASTYAPCWI